MVDTREKILLTALHLFAEKGYEAVSVSSIAGEIGITKGALYKHYTNKQDIFDSIVKRMYEIDEKRAIESKVPEKDYSYDRTAYENTSFESLAEFTINQFIFWTTDSFASDFRKMLSLEQYRNKDMAALYNECIISGPVLYTQKLFEHMYKNGKVKSNKSRELAMLFYAPMFLLISLSDISDDNKLLEELDIYIKEFKRHYVEDKNEIHIK